MGGLLASIFAWVFSKAGKDLLLSVISKLSKTDEGNQRLAEIKASVDIALSRDAKDVAISQTTSTVELQKTKMNMPVFWVIIGGMMIWPFVTLGAITLYNIFWWTHGIWPQQWAIAAYPPSISPWVEKSIDWLYNPLGTPVSVGAALVASRLAGKR